MFTAAVVISMVLAGTGPQHHYNTTTSLVRPSGYGCQPAVTGRRWVSRPILGPAPSYSSPCRGYPGPSYYGAREDDYSRFAVRVGGTRISFSPWQRIDAPGHKYLENARNDWLLLNGYVGGVRTFTNDAYAPACDSDCALQCLPAAQPAENAAPAPAQTMLAPGRIQPRATIYIPPEAPRFKKRMQVSAPRVIVPWTSNSVRTIAGGNSTETNPIRVVQPTTKVASAQ